MEQLCSNRVPVWTVLGRRGRAQVVRALRSAPARDWNLRRLAEAAGVHPVVAGRAVRELAALGAVEQIRPGRDAVVQWRPASRAGRFLASLPWLDLRAEVADAFARAYAAPRGVTLVQWAAPGDDLDDPFVPTRVAVLAGRDEEEALDAVGPALDALRAAGLPAPEVTVHARASLRPGDAVADAVLGGAPLDARRTPEEARRGDPGKGRAEPQGAGAEEGSRRGLGRRQRNRASSQTKPR